MLIKIDHICYSCQKGAEEIAMSRFCGYHELFRQKDIPNLSIKRKRSMRENVSHNIIYLENKGSFPIEITSYENIAEGQDGFLFDYKNNVIEMYSDHIPMSVALLEFCGAKRKSETTDQAEMSMHGILDKLTLTIIIKKSEQPKPWILDRGGNVCLALVVKDLESIRRKIGTIFDVSDIKELEINGRVLKLFFAFGLCGETIEFLSV